MRVCFYYFIGIILSILSGIFLLQKSCLFILSLTFLILLFFKIRTSIGKIVILFLISIVGFISIINYYNVKDGNINSRDFRVVSKTYKDIILKSIRYDSRKYIIKDYLNIDSLNEGMILNIDGVLVEQNYYDIGVSGEIIDYRVNDFRADFIYKFYNMRNIIKRFFVEIFGYIRGNILSGLTFGDTSEIDRQYKQKLKSMGLSHILSVSGFHMNVIFGMISKVLSILPSAIVGFVYLVFVGAKPSGIRAFTMMILKQCAPILHRTYDGLNALFFSGIVILLIRPYELFNMGFVYSFASTLGIVMFNSKINDYFYKLPKIISDSLSLILSAQVFILPIILLSERKIGFRFLFSNIFLVPFYSILIVLGIFLVLFNILPFVKDIIVYFTRIIFDIIDGGLVLIENLVPKEFYLDDSVIIFLLCLYVLYFLSKRITFRDVRNISIGLCCSLFLYMGIVDFKIEYGQYFDKGYVILRHRFRSHMYIDGKVSNLEKIEDELGVDKIFIWNSNQDIEFFKNDIYVDFKDDGVFLNINDDNIYLRNYRDNNKYYDSIYPQKYHVIF